MIVYNTTIRGYALSMESEAQKFGKNLKRIRTKKGLTQGDIVRALGMDRAFVSNIENGKANPTLATITKLAKFLGVSPDGLLK